LPGASSQAADVRIDGQPYRTIFVDDDGWTVRVIDQTRLPFEFVLRELQTVEQAAAAIRDMVVRGAPLIGVTAAYGVALALRADPSNAGLERGIEMLGATRPTAVNLRWALSRMEAILRDAAPRTRTEQAYREAARMADEDVAACAAIGRHGAAVIAELSPAGGGRTINVLTHCNAGWLACVDWGTALAPIYAAHEAGIDVHVYVDETRPRNQGAALTAFELGSHGIPHTVVVDNAGGHLMQHGQVDLCIVGSDRTTGSGDVANKVGTYLKALAARDNGIPFYVALPSSTIDWSMHDGLREIPIEERAQREVTHVRGRSGSGELLEVEVAAPGSAAANPAFDVTPARLVTALITERGVCAASREGLASLFPEQSRMPS
jgi:methylthioribose-1-phosphate isomerase